MEFKILSLQVPYNNFFYCTCYSYSKDMISLSNMGFITFLSLFLDFNVYF